MLEVVGWILIGTLVVSALLTALQFVLFFLEVLCWSWFPEFSVKFSEFRWDVYVAWRKMWRD